MPSRTRIVLRRKEPNEETVQNENAKGLLTSLVCDNIIWKTGLPEGWAKLKLRGKLEYLKTLLPPQWVLEVYTEPRATRPTKSVYKSQFVKEGQKRKRVKRATTRFIDEAGQFNLEDIRYEPVPVDPQPPRNQQERAVWEQAFLGLTLPTVLGRRP